MTNILSRWLPGIASWWREMQMHISTWWRPLPPPAPPPLRQTDGEGFCHDSPADVSTPPLADSQKHRDHVLLVARFDEPLDWLTTLLEQQPWIDNVLVYDKGVDSRSSLEAQFPSDRVRIRKLPNLGREGETLLHYIIEHYDMLPKRIWYMQANPIKHQPRFLELFTPARIKKYDPMFQPLTIQFAEYARIPDYLMMREESQMGGLVKQMWVCSNSGDIMFANGQCEGQAPGLLGVDNIMKDLQEELGVPRSEVISRTISDAGLSLNDTNVLIPYTMSAMFMVSKGAIRANPREFYIRARHYLLYDDDIGRDEPFRAVPVRSINDPFRKRAFRSVPRIAPFPKMRSVP